MVFSSFFLMAQSGDLEHAVGGLVSAPSEFRPSQLQSMVCDVRCARLPADVTGRPTGDDSPGVLVLVEMPEDRVLGMTLSFNEFLHAFPQHISHRFLRVLPVGCHECGDHGFTIDLSLCLYYGGCAVSNVPRIASVVELLCSLLELACEFGAFVVDGDEGGAGAHVVGLEAVDLETVHPVGCGRWGRRR